MIRSTIMAEGLCFPVTSKFLRPLAILNALFLSAHPSRQSQLLANPRNVSDLVRPPNLCLCCFRLPGMPFFCCPANLSTLEFQIGGLLNSLFRAPCVPDTVLGG